MTEIPEAALDKAAELTQEEADYGIYTLEYVKARSLGRAFARYIADVSEKAKTAVEQSTFAGQLPAYISPLQSLILPDPEDDLLKEAREIVRQNQCEPGESGLDYAMRCTLAALKHRKDG